MNYCVIGAGAGGVSIASQLKSRGHYVTIADKDSEKIRVMQSLPRLKSTGKVECEGKPDLITTDIVAAAEGSDVIMVVTTTDAHSSIAKSLAKHLSEKQMVVLCPGHIMGALEFRNTIRVCGCESLPVVAELADLPYACRVEAPGVTFHSGIKTRVGVATVPAADAEKVMAVLGKEFDMLFAADSILDTGTNNIAVITHPIPCAMNVSRIDDGGTYLYYEEGFSRSICKIMEMADQERLNVCKALGLQRDTTAGVLGRNYNCQASNLYDLVKSIPAFKGVKAPTTMNHRFVVEDTINGLVPWASLGKLLGVDVPIMSMFVDLIGAIMDRDFWAEGRTVDKLGLTGMTAEEIIAACK